MGGLTGISTGTMRRANWTKFILTLLSLSQLKPCRSALFREQNARSLQTTTTSASKTITIRFSLWFPQYTDIDDFSELNDPESSVQKGVVASLFTLLCNEADVSVIRDNQDLISQSNLCLLNFESQPRSLQSADSMSIISSEPELLVRRISGDVFTWSTWIMRFGVFQVGSEYYERSVSEYPEMTFSELEIASVEAMEEAFQLMIDSNIVLGRYDELLASAFENSLQVFSSPIREEEDTFREIKSRLFQTAPYNAKSFSAMRFSGLLLLVLTQTTLFALYTLAKRRRKRLDEDEQAEERRMASKSVIVEPGAACTVEGTRTPSTSNGNSPNTHNSR
jgi:hypothetical protein